MGRSVRSVFAVVCALIALPAFAAAQEAVTITGRVTSAEGGAPLGTASVTVEGLGAVTLTRDDGRYTLVIPAARAHGQQATIVARFIGYKAKAATITLAGNIAQDFALDVNPLRLGEVVVTGLGLSSSTEKLGTAISTVDSSLITKSHETNVVEALAGKTPGVNVNQASGDPGASSYIRIRGIKSLSGDAQPLFVVDGVPVDNSVMTAEDPTAGVAAPNRAADINPNDIETVTVLKGAAAAAVYGARAADGVILITTKSGHSGGTHYSLNTNYSFDKVDKRIPLQTDYAQGSGGNHRRLRQPRLPSVELLVRRADPRRDADVRSLQRAVRHRPHVGQHPLRVGRQRQDGVLSVGRLHGSAGDHRRPERRLQAHDRASEGVAPPVRSPHRWRQLFLRRWPRQIRPEGVQRLGADARCDAHHARRSTTCRSSTRRRRRSARIAIPSRCCSTTPAVAATTIRSSSIYAGSQHRGDQPRATATSTSTTTPPIGSRSTTRSVPITTTTSSSMRWRSRPRSFSDGRDLPDGWKQPPDRSQPDCDVEPHVLPEFCRYVHRRTEPELAAAFTRPTLTDRTSLRRRRSTCRTQRPGFRRSSSRSCTPSRISGKRRRTSTTSSI